MLTSRGPNGQIEAYTDIGQFIGILPPDHPLAKNFADDGGPGSGNFGHAGRPGKVGGSQPGGGAHYRGGRSDVGYFGTRKDWLNGLQGEKQHEAVRFLANKKKELNGYLEQKKKIEKLLDFGVLTQEEINNKLKEGKLDFLREGMPVEEYIMKRGSELEKSELIEKVEEARNWENNKEKFLKNLTDDERKVYDWIKQGKNVNEETLATMFDLEAKAMGIPDSGQPIPEELLYESGVKERPEDQMSLKPEHNPGFMKPKPFEKFTKFVNSVSGRDHKTTELYTLFNDMMKTGAAGLPIKASYTEKDHKFRVLAFASTGKLARVELQIPKMQDDTYSAHEAGTTAHELGHFIDFLLREDKGISGDFSDAYKDRFKKLLSEHTETSEETKKLFNDITAKCYESDKRVEGRFKPDIDKLNAQISDVLKTKPVNWVYEYDRLAKERDKLERESENLRIKEARKTAGGVAALMDIFQALGDGPRRFQHSYRTDAERLTECWANWCELSIVFPEDRKVLEKEKPEFCKLMNDMTDEILRRIKNAENS